MTLHEIQCKCVNLYTTIITFCIENLKQNYIVTNVWGGGGSRDLEDGFWIGWLDLLTPYSHTARDYRQYSAILRTLQFTAAHALEFSLFTSRILATDLSLSHCNFKSHMKYFLHSLIPFLALTLRLPIPKTRLHSILSSQPHISAAQPFTSNYSVASQVKLC
jgi:hypothetical protein